MPNASYQPRAVTCIALFESPFSGRGSEVFTNDSGMPSGNFQKSNGRSLRMSSALFPIAQRVNADFHCLSKLSLRQTYEAPKCGDILPRLDLATNEPPTYLCGNRACHLSFRELLDFTHVRFPFV